MDLVNGVLNWVGTPAMVASLLLFYPPYYLFKTCYSFLSWLFPEDVAGKVVLITGASSGIGEVTLLHTAGTCSWEMLCFLSLDYSPTIRSLKQLRLMSTSTLVHSLHLGITLFPLSASLRNLCSQLYNWRFAIKMYKIV
jgi:hypothetical protein